MADLVITPVSVQAYTGATVQVIELGETVTAGQYLRLDRSDRLWYLAQNNVDLTTAKVRAVALKDGNVNDEITAVTRGPFNPGATLANGAYVLSQTLGGVMPDEDLVAGDWQTHLFYAEAATRAYFMPQWRGQAF